MKTRILSLCMHAYAGNTVVKWREIEEKGV